jgi:hypothetical protein
MAAARAPLRLLAVALLVLAAAALPAVKGDIVINGLTVSGGTSALAGAGATLIVDRTLGPTTQGRHVLLPCVCLAAAPCSARAPPRL